MTKKIAIVFPGQGSQYEAMGKDLLGSRVYKLAKDILDKDTYEAIANANIEEIFKTRYAQPAIFMNSMALLDELLNKYKNLEVAAMAGLSLGEYSALCSSAMIGIEEAIGLVAKRGQIMGQGVKGQGTMLAIMKTPLDTIEEIVCQVKKSNPDIKNLDIANINCPGQIVVGGEFSAIDKLEDACKERSIKKTVKLNVEGPFHTSVLKPSADIFRQELEKIDFKFNKDIKVYKNLDASVYGRDQDHVDILMKQMYSRVMFEQTIKNMIDDGIDTFIEVGPGKSLAGFIKKIDKTKKVINIQNLDDIREMSEV